MRRSVVTFTALALASLTALPGVAHATLYYLRAHLDTAQEVPPDAFPSTASGEAWITVDTDANTLTYHIVYSGLSSPEIGAHIHGPAAPGEVAFDYLTFLPLGTPKDGVWNYAEAQESMILSGLTYINVHTSNNGSGEIRGQIVAGAPALDPAMRIPLALGLLVAGALFAARRAPAREL